MSLNIATFSNVTGGNALFKALTHPKIADNARSLLAALRAAGPVAVYDPLGHGEAFADLYGVTGVNIGSVFVLRVEDVGRTSFGRETQPVTALASCKARTLFVAAFDAERAVQQIRHLLPQAMLVLCLDHMRLPDKMLTNTRRYLVLFFFAFFFVFLCVRVGLLLRFLC